jgi:hypothetical protein
MSPAVPRHALLRDAIALILIPFAVWFGLVVVSGIGSTILLSAIAGVASVAIARSRIEKNLLLIVLTVIVTMGVCEVALRIRGPETFGAADWGRGRVQHSSVQTFALSAEYGFDAVPNVVSHVTSSLNGQPVYDVTYTIDAKGARVTPFGAPGGKPVVLTGDSYNFGEGLNDDQTLGFYLQKASHDSLRALNVARPGYGPHQVLRQLQLDLPVEHGLKSFDWLVVSMIDDHIERANGSYAWSLGPRYVLDGHGGVQLSGQYGDRSPPPAWLTQLRNGSRLFVAMEKKIAPLLARDEELFVHILQAARETAQRKFGAQMLVLYYSGGTYLNEFVGRRELMHRLLDQAGVQFIDVNSILPVRDGGYFIAGDGHPTEKLNAELADIILSKIGEPAR